MLLFIYGSLLSQNILWLMLTKEESNKDEKLAELKNQGFEGYCYQKIINIGVLSPISEDQKQLKICCRSKV